jgi:hypothetical protein
VVEQQSPERPRDMPLSPVLQGMDGIAKHSVVQTCGIGPVNPQFLREAFGAFDALHRLKADPPGMGFSASGALGFADKLNGRPARFAEVEILFSKNPDSALAAECRQEEVLETQ